MNSQLNGGISTTTVPAYTCCTNNCNDFSNQYYLAPPASSVSGSAAANAVTPSPSPVWTDVITTAATAKVLQNTGIVAQPAIQRNKVPSMQQLSKIKVASMATIAAVLCHN